MGFESVGFVIIGEFILYLKMSYVSSLEEQNI